MTDVTDYTALLTNNTWNGFFAGQACVVTYSFGTSAPSYVTDGSAGFAPGAGASYETYSAAEKTAARAALAQWAAVCGISFVEVASGGDLAFHKVDIALTPNPDSGGFAIKVNRGYFLGGTGVDESLSSDGDIFIDAVNTPTGTSLAYTLLHEIGHTLGLKHPFEGEPLFAGATTADTVLAYGAAVSSLGTLDPQAARALYGNDTPAANTLLSFNYSAATGILSQTWGSNGNSILGSSSKDAIHAGGGNDRVGGLGDNDRLDGGSGDDQLFGGAGNDVLIGGLGDDLLLGGNTLLQDAGTDTADYSGATSAINVQLRFFFNDPGFNATGASIGNDTLYEIDNVIGGSGGDTISGNQFANVLSGRGGADTLTGYLGDDLLDGGTGADRMAGVTDNDSYVVDNAGDIVDELFSDGIDSVHATVSFSLADQVHAIGDIENLTLKGTANIDGTGNALANRLTGNHGNNSLDGGGGADRMEGRTGHDTYVVDNAGDKVIELAGGGKDTVRSAISYTLGDNVENLLLTGSGAIDGHGNGAANALTGNSGKNKLKGGGGNDVVTGGGGADTLNGNAGNDSLRGGAGKDNFLFDSPLGSANADKILDFLPVDDTIKLSRAIFAQAGANGTLLGSAFRQGTGAADPSDRIIYNSATGKIFYDPDGNGGADHKLFATVTPGTVLTNADFVIFG